MACKISLTAMFCSSCKEMRYSKAWSPLQWESWLTVLQAQDGERNCCRMCSNRFYQSTFPEVPPWKRYINPGDGNYWWHNSDTGEFFYEKTGTTAPPPQESGKCCSESPLTDIPYPWKRYINHGDGNYWWHNPETGVWFSEKTCTTAPPPQ